jgi:hypothetical protein
MSKSFLAKVKTTFCTSKRSFLYSSKMLFSDITRQSLIGLPRYSPPGSFANKRHEVATAQVLCDVSPPLMLGENVSSKPGKSI